ncbi:uncharacterized protein LOC123197150 [Mangifera indica]|uniref:uncharacterized protein LOC123197150 n=1 Tax=Mangifera indica TaxID=29780 RepID=UPI001CFA639B|nr:uncharacterized protein LOC123197150 [Mangifera indica]
MEIGYNQHPSSFYQNLTHLFLWKCGNIKYAFPSSIAKSIHQLQQLKIQNCKVLEEIIAKEDEANAVVNFVFPNITLLAIEDVPELIAFYPGIYALEMPKLKELVVQDCTKYVNLKENNMETELNILDPKSIFLENKINFNLEVFELYDGEANICWRSQSKTLTIKRDISANIPLRLLQRFENVRELQLSWSQYKDTKSLCDLPNLEILEVDYCYRLMSLVPFSGTFQNLKVLKVNSCDELMKLITLSMSRSLVQLRELSITLCKMLIEIVENEGDATTSTEIVFNNLNKLSLEWLYSLTSFCSGNYFFSFPSLEELIIKYCPNLEIFCQGSLCTPKLDRVIYNSKDGNVNEVEIGDNDLNTTIQEEYQKQINHDLEIFQLQNGLEHISWRSQSKELKIFCYKPAHIPLWLLQRFENLTCLFVCGCHELVNLTTPSTARSLVQLRELKISHCKMLMEILEIKEDATTEIVFENLNKLSFVRMENLTCFCSGNYTFNFHSLEELNIANCPNIKTFCRGILSTPKLQKISYKGMKVENEGDDLNKTIQRLYKKENQDISLDLNLKCKVFHHDNSMEIGYNQHPASFYQNLTNLFLWKCGNIKYAFPSSIAKSLHQLKQLKIQNCKALEEIVAKENGANAVVDFVLPNITLLKLEDLPELAAFYLGIYTLEMPKLKKLVVKDCTKVVSLKENNVETKLNILDPKSIFLNNKINFNLEVFELYDSETNICWQNQSKTLTIRKDISANIPLQLLHRFENVRELQLSWSQYKDIKSLCDLPNLEILKVGYCDRLMTLVSFSTSFQDLKVLKVSFCNKLLKLITPSMARSLV